MTFKLDGRGIEGVCDTYEQFINGGTKLRSEHASVPKFDDSGSATLAKFRKKKQQGKKKNHIIIIIMNHFKVYNKLCSTERWQERLVSSHSSSFDSPHCPA